MLIEIAGLVSGALGKKVLRHRWLASPTQTRTRLWVLGLAGYLPLVIACFIQLSGALEYHANHPELNKVELVSEAIRIPCFMVVVWSAAFLVTLWNKFPDWNSRCISALWGALLFPFAIPALGGVIFLTTAFLLFDKQGMPNYRQENA